MLEAIKKALQAVRNFIKNIWVAIINFFENILNFFKDPEKIKKLSENRNVLAVSIKEHLANGNYNVINCLFDKQEGELVEYEKHSLIIQGKELDETTKQHFGNKEMIVLT